MRKNKAVRLSVALLLLSLVLVNVLTFTSPFHGQKQKLTCIESLTPITSDPNAFISIWDTTETSFSSCGSNLIASDPNEFISVWDTTRTSSGSSGSNQVRLPLESSGTYNFMVYWGDGSNDTITNWNQLEKTHTYTSSGVYTITITGTIVGWRFGGVDQLKILEIQQWGCLRLGNLQGYFSGCSNLELTATDNLDLTGTTYLTGAFMRCYNLGSSGNMNGWDVSSVIDMSYMFNFASSFNQPLGNWNVSNVYDMEAMFYGADSFNQPLGNWDVSSVIDMETMFYGALSFNQPLGNWNVSSVYDMDSMFSGASSFNQPIGSWDVSSVTTIRYMFHGASSFNQPIDNWDVSSVIDMEGMFYGALSFNQPLDNWNVSSVNDMQYMFYGALLFNQPLGNWNVSSVYNMEAMFRYATSFNQPIGSWDVSSVETMRCMFYEASSFNQPLGNWDVSNVIYMIDMFYGVTLSTVNYDNLLLGWSQLTLRTGVTFHAGNSKYSNAAKDARQFIITNFAWTIIDGGLATPEESVPRIPGYNLVLMVTISSITIFLVIKKKHDIKYHT